MEKRRTTDDTLSARLELNGEQNTLKSQNPKRVTIPNQKGKEDGSESENQFQ